MKGRSLNLTTWMSSGVSRFRRGCTREHRGAPHAWSLSISPHCWLYVKVVSLLMVTPTLQTAQQHHQEEHPFSGNSRAFPVGPKWASPPLLGVWVWNKSTSCDRMEWDGKVNFPKRKPGCLLSEKKGNTVWVGKTSGCPRCLPCPLAILLWCPVSDYSWPGSQPWHLLMTTLKPLQRWRLLKTFKGQLSTLAALRLEFNTLLVIEIVHPGHHLLLLYLHDS